MVYYQEGMFEITLNDFNMFNRSNFLFNFLEFVTVN
jgi:hypothetical protein